MEAIPVAGLAVLTLWLLYYLSAFGALDPHHIEATPKFWLNCIKSLVIFIALILLPAAKELEPEWVPFLAMFVFAQTVAVAFTWPNRLRKDEEPDELNRLLEKLKGSIGGAALAKIVSIILAFMLSWAIGDWWFVVLIFLGSILIMGKRSATFLMIESGRGEFAQLSQSDRLAKVREWSPLIVRGQVAYVLVCSACGLVLYQYADLQPGNWMSWAGLLSGAIFSAVLSASSS